MEFRAQPKPVVVTPAGDLREDKCCNGVPTPVRVRAQNASGIGTVLQQLLLASGGKLSRKQPGARGGRVGRQPALGDVSNLAVALPFVGDGLRPSARMPLWTNRYNGPGNSFDYAIAVPVLTLEREGNDGFLLKLDGSPNDTYRLHRAHGVTGVWSDLTTNTAPASGLIEYHDTSPLPGQAFYRAVRP